MKDRNTTLKKNKISFWENIFFWIWFYTPKSGYAHRSYGVITIIQYIYIIFVIGILLNCLNLKNSLLLYSNIKEFIFFVGILFPILFFINMTIYNHIKYKKLQDLFSKMTTINRIKQKKKFYVFIILTMLVMCIDIALLNEFKRQFIMVM
jgi:hypothetical protein